MEGRKQFTFYRSYYEAIRQLKPAEKAVIFEAIAAYALDEVEPKLTGMLSAIFELIRPTLDSSARKAANGRAGGKAQASAKQSESKSEANDKQSASDKANEEQTASEKEKEKEYEKEIENECYTPQPLTDEKQANRHQVDYDKIVGMYNRTCQSLPKVSAISEARRKAIRARSNEYSDADFETLFRKAEASSFLKGKNDRNWTANFDWLLADRNMAKVLDGNYDDARSDAKNGAGRETKNASANWMMKYL